MPSLMAFNCDNLAPSRPAKSAFSFCRALVIFITIISSALQNANVDASNILVTNNAQCTRIGKRLMLENASVEQIYVAVSLCEGIVHPMDSGLGGGFQAVLYDYIAGKKVSKYLMSREYSPYSRKFTKRPLLFGNSVGIPAVLAGYARLLGVNDCLVKSPNISGSPHNSQLKYYSHDCIERIKNGVKSGFFDGFYSGTYQNTNNADEEQSRVPPTGVPYQHIFRDCIRLARDGFRVSPTFAAMYSYLSSVDRLISYNPTTGMAINLALANFIEFLSNDPLRLLDPYVVWANRNVAKKNNIRQVMLEDLHYFHSHLTTQDFLSYRADIRPTLAVSFRYRNVTYKLLTMPSPAGGEPIAFFAKMIEAINLISGRRGVANSLNSEQKSILFLLCSRFAYGIKPYFRQLNLATKRKLLVSEAPRLARKFYKQVSRANSSELVRLANQPKYRMFSTFGSIHLPQIRVAKQRHNSDLRAFEDVEENAIETGNFSAIFDQDDHNETETADDSQFDFSLGDDINDEQDDEQDDDMINEPFSPPAPSTSPRTAVHPPLYNHQYEELLTDFTHTMSTINMSEYYHTMDSDTEKEHFITSEDFEGGVDDNPYGTTNVIVKKGKRAIVATSSINHSYGSGIASSRLGIFYNNVLRDFTPNTWYQRIWLRNGTKKFRRFPNRIRPHFVPSSSMGCTLLINPATNNPVFGIGAAGGFKITGAIFNTLWNYFVHGLSLNNSIKRLRLITKMNYKSNISELWYELPPHINASLIASKNNRPFKELNLNFSNSDLPHSIEFFYRYRTELNVMFIKEAGYSAVTAFTTLRGVAMGSYDHRRGGEAYIYK